MYVIVHEFTDLSHFVYFMNLVETVQCISLYMSSLTYLILYILWI